jgi:hypothetical protein
MKFQVQLSGIRNGGFCSSFLKIESKTESEASAKALRKTDLTDVRVVQTLKLSVSRGSPF